MIRITNTVKHLIIINVLFWIATLGFGEQGSYMNSLFAFHFPLSEMFQPWQIITHMFMHASYVSDGMGGTNIYLMHILFNMIGLWMFGSAVENYVKRKKFLILYFVAGLGALLLTFAIDYADFMMNLNKLVEGGYAKDEILKVVNEGKYDPAWDALLGEGGGNSFSVNFNGSMLGASGALMGVLVAFGLLFPNAELMLIFLPIPIKAKYFIPVIIGLDIFSGLTGVSIFSPSNTAYWAHIGGAVTGFIVMWIWKKRRKIYF
ncbi:MAG: rhomboid family intramembrane serine protease [Flavobacteriaceae bacterium]|nr:rhomboid family intramembrane serine protease [Flavobacteriaceae bacterium]